MTTRDDLFNPGGATDYFKDIPAPFNPQATAYDDANAWWLAELSRLVYKAPTRKEYLDKAGLEELLEEENPHSMVVRAKNGSWAAVVFRGTEEWHDWVLNADFPFAEWNPGSVHEGFETAWKGMWSKIEESIKDLHCPLFITGHSLGAAVATLAASKHPPRAAYTYGSPLVGNGEFAESFAHSPLYRVVNHLDCVTHVPLKLTLFPYHHAGELHAIGKKPSVLDFALDLLHIRQCKESEDVTPAEPLLDHAPINYVRLLAARLPARPAPPAA